MNEIKDKDETENEKLNLKTENKKLIIIIFLALLSLCIIFIPIQYFTALITIIGVLITLTFYMPISNIKKNQKQVILIILSILMFASLFSGSYRITDYSARPKERQVLEWVDIT